MRSISGPTWVLFKSYDIEIAVPLGIDSPAKDNFLAIWGPGKIGDDSYCPKNSLGLSVRTYDPYLGIAQEPDPFAVRRPLRTPAVL